MTNSKECQSKINVTLVASILQKTLTSPKTYFQSKLFIHLEGFSKTLTSV